MIGDSLKYSSHLYFSANETFKRDVFHKKVFGSVEKLNFLPTSPGKNSNDGGKIPRHGSDGEDAQYANCGENGEDNESVMKSGKCKGSNDSLQDNNELVRKAALMNSNNKHIIKSRRFRVESCDG